MPEFLPPVPEDTAPPAPPPGPSLDRAAQEELERKVADLVSPTGNQLLAEALAVPAPEGLAGRITALTSDPAADLLEVALAPVPAPADLTRRILAATSEVRTDAPAPLPLHRRWLLPAALAAAAAAALATALLWPQLTGSAPAPEIAVRTPTDPAPPLPPEPAPVNGAAQVAGLQLAVLEQSLYANGAEDFMDQAMLRDELDALASDLALLDG